MPHAFFCCASATAMMGRLRCLSLLWVVAWCVSACGEAPAEAAPTEAEAKTPTLPYFEDGVIRLPEVFLERIALVRTPVIITEVTPVIHVTGVLEFDEQRIAAVGSRISGRVRDVRVIEGTSVSIGDELATLESAELGRAQAEIFSVKARAQYADSDERRKQQLLREGIASKRAAELAAQESSITEAELRAAKQRVHALGGSVGANALGVLSLTSPIDGDVVDVHVFRGQAVEPSHTAFIIADRTSLWLRLAVFESEVSNIRVDDDVELSAQVTPDKVLTGKVTFISTVLDPVTRSAEVRVIVPNETGNLRVGQAINARIRPSATVKRALAVPREAVMLVDGNPTVFVEVDATGVIPRAVKLGLQGSKVVEIVEGLAEGDVVITEGMFALKAELFR